MALKHNYKSTDYPIEWPEVPEDEVLNLGKRFFINDATDE